MLLKYNDLFIKNDGVLLQYIAPGLGEELEITVNTNLISGTTYTLGLDSLYNYSCIVDWGDGTQTAVNSWDAPGKTHIYSTDGIYNIKIFGLCEYLSFAATAIRASVISVNKWSNSLELKRIIFDTCTNLSSVTSDLSSDPFSLITSFETTFRNCTSLTEINWPNLNVNNCTTFNQMFRDCTNLTTVNLENLSITSVNSIGSMFSGCNSLTSININNWNIGINSVTFSSLFSGCTSLSTITGITDFVKSNVNNISSLFNSCSSLLTLDLSLWNTSNVLYFSSVFQNCILLTTLNLSNWNIEAATNFNNFLTNVPLTINSYDSILNNFGLQDPNFSLTFDANLCEYSGAAVTARTNLINNYNWTINDAGIYDPLYTDSEITDLINIDGYIPVATATELDNLKNAVSQTMGSGTIWEGTYTTGVNKKYVQVRNIDLDSIIPRILNFSGIYDSNNLLIDVNWSVTVQESAIFQSLTSAAILRNFNATGTINANSINFVAFICFTGNSALIENSTVNGNIINGGTRCSLYGTSINLNNCKGFGSIECGAESGGLVAGGVNINNCYADMDITSSGNFVGVLASSGAIQIDKCETHGSITGTSTSGTFYYGGLIGLPATGSNINNSFSTVNISAPNTTYIGGAIGRVRGIALNCYSTGSVSGNGLGGFTGLNQGTITNCYYDTNTSGQSDTGKGLPRTTLQMQQGTADSFILPGGGVDGTEDPANAMYTNWDNLIWEFEPDTEYPEIIE